MNANKIQIIAKQTTALLSAIAASSFLGLPVLAQVNTNQPSNANETTGASVYERSRQTSQSATECVPISSQSDRSSMRSSTITGSTMTGSGDRLPADSSDPAVQQYPNQSDPRAVAPADMNNTGSTDAAGNITGSVNNQSGTVQTGDLPYGSATSQSRVSTETVTTSVAPNGQLSQGGVGGPVDGSTTTTDSVTQTTGGRTTDYNMTATTNNASIYGSDVNPTYGNVLARGGSTTGGGALRILEAATDPDWRDRSADDDNDNNRVSSRYGQSQSSDNQLQTSGVTSGGQANQSGVSSNQNQSAINQSAGATTGNPTDIRTSGVTSGGEAINQTGTASDQNQAGVNQTGTISQPSQTTSDDRMMNNCPPGMMLRQSSRLNQQGSGSSLNNTDNNQVMPGRALPNQRQNPGAER